MDSPNSVLDDDPPTPTSPVQTGSQIAVAEDISASDRAVSGFKLDGPQRSWLIDNHYATYLQFKRRRGTRTRPNAKSYSHDLAVPFEQQFLSGWSQAKRLQYRPRIKEVRNSVLLSSSHH